MNTCIGHTTKPSGSGGNICENQHGQPEELCVDTPRGKGKSSGKGKRRFQFMAEMTDAELEELYFKGRGKRGGGKKASEEAREKDEEGDEIP